MASDVTPSATEPMDSTSLGMETHTSPWHRRVRLHSLDCGSEMVGLRLCVLSAPLLLGASRRRRGGMDVFKVHERVIGDYRAFTSGFVEVRDRRIQTFVDQQFADGVQWPDPWLSLNPSFASGGAVPDLVAQGLLHPECERIFRRKNDLRDLGRDPIVLHQHQREAVEVARTGKSYVLTTGTGSGKSLAYIVPIVDAV